MSLRTGKIFQAAPDQIKRLAGYSYDSTAVLKYNSLVTSANTDGLAGSQGAVIDATSSTWASGNLRVLLVANAASDANQTLAMKTQSHAFGQYLEGSASFSLYCEAPTVGSAQDYFERTAMFHLQGQLGAPVTLYFCANGTEPTIKGLNGAGATATFTAAGTFVPYGGGVGYTGGV